MLSNDAWGAFDVPVLPKGVHWGWVQGFMQYIMHLLYIFVWQFDQDMGMVVRWPYTFGYKVYVIVIQNNWNRETPNNDHNDVKSESVIQQIYMRTYIKCWDSVTLTYLFNILWRSIEGPLVQLLWLRLLYYYCDMMIFSVSLKDKQLLYRKVPILNPS